MKVAWQTKPFEECIEKVAYTSKIQRKDFLADGVYPIVSQEESFINGYWDEEDDLFEVTTPLVIFGDHTRVLKYVDFDFVLGADGVKLLQPREFLEPKFFYYQLQTANLDSLGYARHYRLLKELDVVYPGRTEQHRIVALLDEAFAGIAIAKANAEKSLRNARDVFSGYLDAMLDKSKDIKERRLGDLVTRLTNGYVGPIKNVYVETGVPYLLARHVRDNKLKFDGKTLITDEFNQKNRKSILKIGDVLLVQSGHIGHSAVVTEEHEGHNCHAMIVITPVEGAMTGEFLSLLFNSAKMRKEFDAIRSGSTVPHLTCKEVKEMPIKLPDLAMQKKMVAQSNELQAETQRLEYPYNRKLAALDELKKSLLQQAFSGQL